MTQHPLQNSVSLRPVVVAVDRMTSRVAVDRALRQAELSRKLISGPPVFVPFSAEAVFAEAVARYTGERNIGAMLGSRYRYTDLSWYSKFVLTAPTLGEAFLRAGQALPVMHPGSDFWLDASVDPVVLRFRSGIQTITGARHIDEFMPFLIIDLVRHFAGPDWNPIRVDLPDLSRPGGDALETLFAAPVHFGSRRPGIALPADLLATPNRVWPEARNQVVLHDLPKLLGVAPPQTFTDSVTETLRVQLALGDVSADAVGERLGLGVRTLQRRLRSEGTSFSDVQSDFLKQRAVVLLSGSDFTVQEIANSLGYQETNSFRRAFRKWTGVTPTVYVNKLATS